MTGLTRTLITIVLALAASWTMAGAAIAATPPPTPALDQYVETFPTATGPATPATGRASGTGSGSTQTVVPLEPEAAARLEAEGGDDAEVLKKIATQPDLGAPEAPLSPETPEAEPQPEAQPEAAPAVETSDGRQVELLVGLLAAITLAVGGTAGYAFARRRGL